MMMTHRIVLKTHPLWRHTFALSIRSYSGAACKRRSAPKGPRPSCSSTVLGEAPYGAYESIGETPSGSNCSEDRATVKVTRATALVRKATPLARSAPDRCSPGVRRARARQQVTVRPSRVRPSQRRESAGAGLHAGSDRELSPATSYQVPLGRRLRDYGRAWRR